MRSADALKIGSTVVAMVLIGSGVNDIAVPEIYRRVRLLESEPLLKGAPVVLLGLLEPGSGALFLYRQWLRPKA